MGVTARRPFPTKDLIDFDRGCARREQTPSTWWSLRFDGLSVSLEYRDGLFPRFHPRGRPGGEDVTITCARSAPCLEADRPVPYLEVRGEVYMPRDSFSGWWRAGAQGETPFKNPAQRGGGFPAAKEPAHCRRHVALDIFVFNVQQIYGASPAIPTSNRWTFLKEMGFPVSPSYRRVLRRPRR